MNIAFLLACLASLAAGRRAQAPYVDSERPSRAANQGEVFGGQAKPLTSLAMFVLALNPEDAFSPAGTGISKQAGPDPLVREALKRRHRICALHHPSLVLSSHQRATVPACQAPAQSAGPQIDLVGDGGVLKTVLEQGRGKKPPTGATVEVHYEGRIVETGKLFDSSRARGQTFKFTLGEGKVIGGWEVALSTMQVGEVSMLTVGPQYAYGAKGIPPTIPPGATLEFEVELVGVELPEVQDFDAGLTGLGGMMDGSEAIPDTVEGIKAAYERSNREKAMRPAKKEGLEGLKEMFTESYFFGFFEGEDGETPPWYFNPLITFPSIFVGVFLAFLVIVGTNNLHRGIAPLADDDLRTFIELTDPPLEMD